MTATVTCFDWCISDHADNRDLHEQADTQVDSLNGGPLRIGVFHDTTTGRTGIHVDGKELSPASAVNAAVHLLAAVGLVLELPSGWPSQNMARAALEYAVKPGVLADLADLLDGGEF